MLTAEGAERRRTRNLVDAYWLIRNDNLRNSNELAAGLVLYLSMPMADPQCVAEGQGASTATSRSPHASDPTWNEILVGADGRFNQHSPTAYLQPEHDATIRTLNYALYC